MTRRLNQSRLLTVALAILLAAAPAVFAQNENQGHGQATVTVLPKKGPEAPSDIAQQAVEISVNGRKAAVSTWQAMRNEHTGVELVLLIDESATSSLGREMNDISQFVRNLPPNVKFTIAYMQNGRAALAGPLTADRAQALKDLRLPMGQAGGNGSPYFCLSDLANHWPSNDRDARRQVIMITDGVDRYHLRYDPNDPYIQTAIRDSARAHMVVFAVYWHSAGRIDRSGYESSAGQNYLLQMTQATGGKSYWIGFGNPVSLRPYFEDFSRRLENQYELGFTVPLHGKAQVETLKVKIKAADTSVTSPQEVWIAPAGAPQP